jgi:hypothetical protein
MLLLLFSLAGPCPAESRLLASNLVRGSPAGIHQDPHPDQPRLTRTLKKQRTKEQQVAVLKCLRDLKYMYDDKGILLIIPS